MFDWLFTFFGWIFRLIFSVVQNYGVALILLTILIKCLILPLNIKSQKAMLKQQKLQPLMQEVQRKYAHDKEKQSQELMKLYKENGASPTAGCLPMLLQFPIVIALYNVLQRPLSYILGINFNLPENITKVCNLQSAVAANPELAAGAQKFTGATMEMVANNSQIQMSDYAAKIGGEFNDWALNFNFLGLNLSQSPSMCPILDFIIRPAQVDPNLFWRTLPLLLIPVLAGVTSWLLGKMTQNKNQQNQMNTQQNDQNSAAQMNKSMTWMMPIMSVVFTFTLPAGIGLYWITSNVFQMIQQHITTVIFKKKEDEIVVIDTVKKNRKDSKNR